MSEQQPQQPTVIPASVVFGNLLAVLDSGLYSGPNARAVAEARMFLEQLVSAEKLAETKKAAGDELHEKNRQPTLVIVPEDDVGTVDETK